jgi:hypothetical protein
VSTGGQIEGGGDAVLKGQFFIVDQRSFRATVEE